MRRFLIDGKEYFCPRGLDECSDAVSVGQVLTFKTVLANYAKEGERTLLKVKLFQSLTGVKDNVMKQLTAGQVQRMLSMIAWCKYAKVEKEKPFEFFEVDQVRYYLPAENLGDMSSIELAMMTVYSLAFSRETNPNLDAIFSVIATVCRPERADLKAFRKSGEWSGDVREEYNSQLADERAALFKTKVPFGIVQAVYMYVLAMSSDFWKRYEKLLGETDEEPLYENGEGQITMLMEIAGMGVFGNFENVCKQNVHTIYLFLKDKKLKLDRMKLQQPEEDDE